MDTYIYIFSSDIYRNSVKIGSSNNPLRRKNDLQAAIETKLKIMKVYQIINYSAYYVDEILKKTYYYKDGLKMHNIIIKNSHMGGGTEHYRLGDMNKYTDIDKFFKLIGIEYIILDNFTIFLHNKEKHKEYNLSYKILLELENRLKNALKINNKFTFTNFRYGQHEAYNNFKNKLTLNTYWGLFIAPTGYGKSLMHLLYIGLYWQKYNKNIILITKRKDILIDQLIDIKNKINNLQLNRYFPNKKYKISNQIIKLDFDKINKKSKILKLILINSDKLIERNVICNFKKIKWKRIGFVIFDECHWAGSYKNYQLMKYIKTRVNYGIGSSATPVRENKNNQDNIKKLYYNNDNKNYEILYQMSYEDAWNNNIIVPVNHIYFNVQDYKIIAGYNNRSKYKFGINGKNIIINEINKYYKVSLFKKMIFYFESRNSLLIWHNFIKTNKYFYNCKLYVSFSYDKKIANKLSKVKLTKDMIKNGVTNFKKKERNAILFVVYRATEGFDDSKVDIVANLDFAESRTITMLLQKIGRCQRLHNKKKICYYLSPVPDVGKMYYIDYLCNTLNNYIKAVTKNNYGNIKNNKYKNNNSHILNILENYIKIKGSYKIDHNEILSRITMINKKNMTLNEFIDILKINNIKTYVDYYKFIKKKKNMKLNLPYIYNTIFPNFRWSMVNNNNNYYKENEIVKKIKEIYINNNVIFNLIKNRHDKILKKLIKFDKKIPNQFPWKYYKINKEKFSFIYSI